MALPVAIIVIVIVVVVALFFLLSGGSSDSGNLYDTWNIDSMEVSTIGGVGVTTPMDGTITFNSDGTYTTTGQTTAYFSDSGTYEKDGNTLTINVLEWDYEVNGNTLTLENEISIFGIGETTTFHCTRA